MDRIPRVSLAEAVEAVRSELAAALSAGSSPGSDQVRFHVSSVELEFAVEVGPVEAASSKVGVWVVPVGSVESEGEGKAHRLRVRLDPAEISRGDRPIIIEGAESGVEHWD